VTRINVTDSDGHVVGWFDIDAATRYPEGTRWDGHNNVSLAGGSRWGHLDTGSRWEHELLFRTAGGRWVVNHWSRWQGVPEWYRFVTDEEAREWLIRCEYPAAEVEAATGVPVESERGPGRPEIGPAFSVRFPADLLARVDAAAEAARVSRAGWLREVAERAVSDASIPLGLSPAATASASTESLDQAGLPTP